MSLAHQSLTYEYRLIFTLDAEKGSFYCFPCDEHGKVLVRELSDRDKAAVPAARIRARNGCRVTIDRVVYKDGEIFTYEDNWRVIYDGAPQADKPSRGSWITGKASCH